MDRHELSLMQREKSHTSWAHTADRSARTAKARATLEESWVEKARAMHPEATQRQIEQAAESLRRAHYLSMARKSAAARRKRREADVLEAEVAEGLADLAGDIA